MNHIFKRELVKASLEKLFRDKAREAFDLTQQNCPVKTGALKRSGRLGVYSKFIEISYHAPYVGVVEEGSPEMLIVVPPGLTNKGTYRSAYSYVRPEIKGTHFIGNSVDQVFSTISNAVDDMIEPGFKLDRG
jgi:hypothetical protein